MAGHDAKLSRDYYVVEQYIYIYQKITKIL